MTIIVNKFIAVGGSQFDTFEEAYEFSLKSLLGSIRNYKVYIKHRESEQKAYKKRLTKKHDNYECPIIQNNYEFRKRDLNSSYVDIRRLKNNLKQLKKEYKAYQSNKNAC